MRKEKFNEGKSGEKKEIKKQSYNGEWEVNRKSGKIERVGKRKEKLHKNEGS